jgi:hypothetical protein
MWRENPPILFIHPPTFRSPGYHPCLHRPLNQAILVGQLGNLINRWFVAAPLNP